MRVAVLELSNQFKEISRRTRSATGVSAVVHLVFMLFLLLVRQSGPVGDGITEVTWLESDGSIPAMLPAVPTSLPPTPNAVVETPEYKPVAQEPAQALPVADVAPDSRLTQDIDDKIGDRLAVLQKSSAEKTAQIASLAKPTPGAPPRLAGVSSEFRPGSGASLKRGIPGPASSGNSPIGLIRNQRPMMKAAVVPTPVPDAPSAQKATPRETDTTARRVLAGAQLAGPVADRPVLHYEVPVYPDWAKREAVEGSVAIYFIVLPDGHVKENIMVQKTSGFEDFDENGVKALLTWRFEPLKTGMTGEQWGTITFNYRLSDAN
jgi:TonB family protein